MDESARRMYLVVALASLAIIVVVSVYGIVESLYVTGQPVGETWVNVYFPFPPYFAQPITYFAVACVALFYSGLRIGEERISKWPHWLLMTIQLFGFIVAFSAAYEVMYNFMLWGSAYTSACSTNLANHIPCNPNNLFSTYPTPWNLVFATRAFFALFVISGYTVYYLRKFSDTI